MRTYRSIAATLGVQLCPDAEGNFLHGCNIPVAWHDTGRVEGRGTVHWTDRRVTPRGLYRFLGLVVVALDGEAPQRNDWERIYLRHMSINRLARRARVRIPRDLTTLERRRVKALLVGVPTSAPLRKKAFRWARR